MRAFSNISFYGPSFYITKINSTFRNYFHCVTTRQIREIPRKTKYLKVINYQQIEMQREFSLPTVLKICNRIPEIFDSQCSTHKAL